MVLGSIDDRYARVRVRHNVLPILETELGPGVTEALARTAHQLTDDADALDALATEALRHALGNDGSLDIAQATTYPRAVQSRVIHRWLTDVAEREMSNEHVTHVRLLMLGEISGQVHVPGLTVTRVKKTLHAQPISL